MPKLVVENRRFYPRGWCREGSFYLRERCRVGGFYLRECCRVGSFTLESDVERVVLAQRAN